jgi:ABC-type multidrug transport system fused ATPase/permease subunit
MTTPSEQLDTRAGAGLIARCLRAEWPPLAAGLVGAIVWSGARLSIPILTGVTIDRAINSGGGTDVRLLGALALAIAALAAVQGLAAASRRYFAMRMSYRVETDLRSALYNRVNRLSFDYYDRTATGQLMSRGSADLHEIQQFVVAIPINAAGLLMAAGAFVAMLLVHVGLAFSALCVYPLVS